MSRALHAIGWALMAFGAAVGLPFVVAGCLVHVQADRIKK